jgi:hypothetical protein
LNSLKANNDIKFYPDQPVLNEQKLPEGIAASKQEKIALIPSVAGKHVLPAIEIPWFNTKTQKREVAKIPETTINVIGASDNQPDESSPSKTAIASISPQSKQEPTISNQAPNIVNPWEQNNWFWTALFFAAGWLLTVFYLLGKQRKHQSVTQQKAKDIERNVDLKQIAKNLKLACSEDDAVSAKNVLLAWGKQQYAADNLNDIAAKCNARLRDEILHLNQTLYSKNKNLWLGKNLLEAFVENKVKTKSMDKDEAVLEPLHRL